MNDSRTRLRLAQHPDLLAQVGVLAAEDLLGERAPQLARLRQHPALLGLARGEEAARATGPGAVRIERSVAVAIRRRAW